MSRMKPTVDNKSLTSSLSADAAEFVPQSGSPQQTNSTAAEFSHTPHTRWKGEKSVEVTEVPRYLTSCYPFVSSDGVARHHVARFPQQCAYPGGIPPALPMPATSPIRFPTWQAVKPAFVDNFQPMSLDMFTTLSVDMFSVRGDGLLPVPSKIAMTAQPPPGQGMLLAPHHDSPASWIMTVPPPMFLQQQQLHSSQQPQPHSTPQQPQLHSSPQQPQLHSSPQQLQLHCSPQQQQLHSSQQQQQHLAIKTTTASYSGVAPAATRKHVDRSKTGLDSVSQRRSELATRPQSPVLISRSTQTDLPPVVHNFTLEEMPHPLYVNHSKNGQSVLSRPGINCEGHEWKAEHEDSDSGYNSPMHKLNLVSIATQVIPSRIPTDNSRRTETAHSNIRLKKSPEHVQTTYAAKIVKKRVDNGESMRSEVKHRLNENSEVDGNKKKKKMKDQRDATRSPRMLGSNTKLLSRSSSSVSSSGTKPDEEDEKIDLYSWTDFPPMSLRVGPPSSSSKPLLKSPSIDDERVPLTIERSAHEPPWSIKFSSIDQTRSERSRSSSGDKDGKPSPKFVPPPESAWGKIGRSFRNSNACELDKELSSLLMTRTETVPLLSSGGKTGNSCGGAGGAPLPSECITNSIYYTGSVLRGPSVQTNRNNTPMNRMVGIGRGEHKQIAEPVSMTRLSNGNLNVVNGVWKSHIDQSNENSTLTEDTKQTFLSATYSTESSASLSSRPATVTTVTTTITTASSISFSASSASVASTATFSPYKDDVTFSNGPSHLKTSLSQSRSSYSSSHSPVMGTINGKQFIGASNGIVNASSHGIQNPSNGIHQRNGRSQSDAVNMTSFGKTDSITHHHQPMLSSASSLVSPMLQQTTSFNNLTVGQLRPGLRGTAPSINYHIPPPSVPHGGVSHHNPAFNSYANIAQGFHSPRTTSPGFVPRASTNYTVHQAAATFQSGSVPFIPPPHTFAAPPPSAYYTGVIPYQPPPSHTAQGVYNNYHNSTDVVLQPPGLSAANILQSGGTNKNSDVSVPSQTLHVTNRSDADHTSHCVSPSTIVSDVRTSSTLDSSVQQHFNNELKPQNVSDGALNSNNFEGNEKRRRRRRRRTRGQARLGGKETEDGDGGSDGSRVLERAISSSNASESTLHFEDVDEFPDLLTTVAHGHAEDIGGSERAMLSGASITYSDILKSTWSKAGSQSRTQSLTGSCVSGDIDDEDNTSCHTGTTNESKRARKRRKRREQANKAAEAELAEISLEQQWLKEVGLKKSANHRAEEIAGGSSKATPGLITDSYVISEAKRHTGSKSNDKKSQQPIALDIAAMIDALQKKPAVLPAADSSLIKSPTSSISIKVAKKDHISTSSVSSNVPGNMLDSSAPLQKRGKEREIGKTKKPSPLKKVILKEREQRKRLRLLDEDPDSATGLGSVGTSSGVGIVGGESELSQDALSSKSGDTDGEDTNEAAELSADFSPISQTSPISMSPASPGNSGVNSPVTGSVGRDPVVMKIHSRRFREYCTQILDKEIDQCCTSLLQDLVKFQDRMYHKDPVKAKTKRRVVLGLREVTKHLKLKKIKCVVISPNLEKIQSKGGLDEALNNILNMCREQDVPFVFALGRRALGRACAKLVPVSVVGIFNYDGCESKYRSLISLTAAARTAYNEMVLEVEKEVAEYPTMASQTSSIGGVPGLFAAHMGHSRTPSGCSAISFTSSILSEPISENFPHAEPEVDSKGYEIVRDAAGNVVHPSGAGPASKVRGKLIADIDDGNEADTEDFCEIRRKRRGRQMNSVRFGDIVNDVTGSSTDDAAKENNCDVNVDSISDDADERSTIGKLSRNVSELTLTNEDNFILKGEPYVMKHKSSLQNLDDDSEEFNDEKDRCDDDDDDDDSGKEDHGDVCEESESSRYQKWARVSHIDSIHSQNYNLGDDIFSHHATQSHDPNSRSQSVTFGRHSQQLSPSSLGGGGSDGHHTGQKSSYEDKDDDDVDNNIDNVDDGEDEEDNGASERHHRVIDKERIKNWLESQSNISTED